MFSLVGGEEFERLLDRMGQAAAMAPVEPAHARKLLRDLSRTRHDDAARQDEAERDRDPRIPLPRRQIREIIL